MKAIIHQIKPLQRQLSMLRAREMELKINDVKQRKFELANKPRRQLAYKLQKEKKKSDNKK